MVVVVEIETEYKNKVSSMCKRRFYFYRRPLYNIAGSVGEGCPLCDTDGFRNS